MMNVPNEFLCKLCDEEQKGRGPMKERQRQRQELKQEEELKTIKVRAQEELNKYQMFSLICRNQHNARQNKMQNQGQGSKKGTITELESERKWAEKREE